jgi:hypothetical protein
MVKGHLPCFPLATAQVLVLVVHRKSHSSMRNNGKTSVIDCGGYISSFNVIVFPMVTSLASHD